MSDSMTAQDPERREGHTQKEVAAKADAEAARRYVRLAFRNPSLRTDYLSRAAAIRQSLRAAKQGVR